MEYSSSWWALLVGSRFGPFGDLRRKKNRAVATLLIANEDGAEPVATAQRGQSSVLRIGIVLRVADLNRWAKKMASLISKIKRRLSRDFPTREVKFDDAGFTVFEEEKQPVRADWLSVKEVFAYKDDLFAYDEICVGFRFDDAGAYWWVGEDYVGYKKFVEELKSRFPGIKTDWFSEVAFPPFLQNRTTLWGTSQSQPKK